MKSLLNNQKLIAVLLFFAFNLASLMCSGELLAQENQSYAEDTLLQNDSTKYDSTGFFSKYYQVVTNQSDAGLSGFQRFLIKSFSYLAALIAGLIILANAAKIIFWFDHRMLGILRQSQTFESFPYKINLPWPKQLTNRILFYLLNERSYPTYVVWPIKSTILWTLLLLLGKLFFRNFDIPAIDNFLPLFFERPLATSYFSMLCLAAIATIVVLTIESIKKVKFFFILRIAVIFLLMGIAYFLTSYILLLLLFGFFALIISGRARDNFWYIWYNYDSYSYHNNYAIYEPWEETGIKKY